MSTRSGIKTVTVEIAASGTDSDPFDMAGFTSMIILTPAALTGTSFTFKTAQSASGTFLTVTKEDGTDYSVTAAASKAIGVPTTSPLSAARQVKIVSGSAEAAARTLTILLKGGV